MISRSWWGAGFDPRIVDEGVGVAGDQEIGALERELGEDHVGLILAHPAIAGEAGVGGDVGGGDQVRLAAAVEQLGQAALDRAGEAGGAAVEEREADVADRRGIIGWPKGHVVGGDDLAEDVVVAGGDGRRGAGARARISAICANSTS
jgi:hypothetical protein